MRSLPPRACPGGQAVISLTLHPTYLAKSYYPDKLLEALDLRHVGSRAVHLIPERTTGAKAQAAAALGKAKPQPAPQYYLAADADRIKRFAAEVDRWAPFDEDISDQFRQIELVSLPGEERLKPIPEQYRSPGAIVPLEVVLHASNGQDNRAILAGFRDYVKTLGLDVDLKRRRHTGGLCFVPMLAPYETLPEITKFSFLRALRRVPRLVPLDPFVRRLTSGFQVTLPDEDPLASDLAVAIFDGGLPDGHALGRWVDLHDAADVGTPVPAYQSHGLAVTSAFLFGPLKPGATPPRPFSRVEHWRVLGDDTVHDDFELYSVLSRIEDVLESKTYDFINISLGPDCALEDDDVNAWTSTLDSLLVEGKTVATVACGNNGEADSMLGLNRVQPPSDGVNMIGVGATDTVGTGWSRAPYSATGPGRSPGYVKPDFLAFGGSPSTPFLVLDADTPGLGRGDMGTSFAAPLAMRAGAGIRAKFTEDLWAPTIKALMVHHANPEGAPKHEVGWGRLSHELDDLVLCGDGEAHIIYQRQMPLTGSVRLYLPIPDGMTGDVFIKATFSYYCDIDPEDALNYTRAGLDIQFRPDTLKRGKPYQKDGRLITPRTPPSDSFFGANDFYSTEVERRQDAQKWETTLSAAKTKRSSSLNQPAFDVSYLAREHGHGGRRDPQTRFALVLTLRNKRMTDLYERIINRYRTRLQPLRPRQEIPLRLPRR
ncbi:S8 family peptidase [Azospirillum sp. CT11-132]|uniref:S8 family peptidase n=1 Tax=Azospirillum sp. CT11-132 TaxID=3396317 RepID=UPI0039A5277B